MISRSRETCYLLSYAVVIVSSRGVMTLNSVVTVPSLATVVLVVFPRWVARQVSMFIMYLVFVVDDRSGLNMTMVIGVLSTQSSMLVTSRTDLLCSSMLWLNWCMTIVMRSLVIMLLIVEVTANVDDRACETLALLWTRPSDGLSAQRN